MIWTVIMIVVIVIKIAIEIVKIIVIGYHIGVVHSDNDINIYHELINNIHGLY